MHPPATRTRTAVAVTVAALTLAAAVTQAGAAPEPGGIDADGMLGDGVSTDPDDPEKVRPNAALYETLDEQADSGRFELPDVDPETVQDDHLFEDLDEQAGA